jgi:hypothetical protein
VLLVAGAAGLLGALLVVLLVRGPVPQTDGPAPDRAEGDPADPGTGDGGRRGRHEAPGEHDGGRHEAPHTPDHLRSGDAEPVR